MYKPPSISRREESFTRRQFVQRHFPHLAEMYETCKEDYSKRCAIVFDENSDVVLEHGTSADDSTEVAYHENEKGYHDGEVERLFGSLACEDLDAFLNIDECNVESEDIAGEPRNVFESITGIGDGEDPVHDHGPSRNTLVSIFFDEEVLLTIQSKP
jgi:hypothetical protein